LGKPLEKGLGRVVKGPCTLSERVLRKRRRLKLANLSDKEVSFIEDWYYAYCLFCDDKGLKIKGERLALELGFEEGIY